MTWLREQTPDPFDRADLYHRNLTPPSDGAFDYPDGAYGVLGWWDYGSSITLADGESVTVDFSATDGVLQIA